MMTISRIASISLLALALSAAACGGTTATDQGPQTAQGAATTAPVGAQTHGFVKIAGDALGEVPLRPDQRTELEKLATDADARHQSIASARQDLVTAVAAQVEAGSIDRAALQPKIDAAAAAYDKIRDQDRAALERVHAILDSTQRTQFADALVSHMKAAHGGAHAENGGHNAKQGMHQWAADLNLTDAQKDQIKQAFHDKMKDHAKGAGHAEWKDHKAQAGKVLDAFKSDHFVMNEVSPKVDAKVAADKMSSHMIGMMETVLPILTAEQRTIAAQKLRTQHAAADAVMAPSMHGPL